MAAIEPEIVPLFVMPLPEANVTPLPTAMPVLAVMAPELLSAGCSVVFRKAHGLLEILHPRRLTARAESPSRSAAHAL